MGSYIVLDSEGHPVPQTSIVKPPPSVNDYSICSHRPPLSFQRLSATPMGFFGGKITLNDTINFTSSGHTTQTNRIVYIHVGHQSTTTICFHIHVSFIWGVKPSKTHWLQPKCWEFSEFKPTLHRVVSECET